MIPREIKVAIASAGPMENRLTTLYATHANEQTIPFHSSPLIRLPNNSRRLYSRSERGRERQRRLRKERKGERSREGEAGMGAKLTCPVPPPRKNLAAGKLSLSLDSPVLSMVSCKSMIKILTSSFSSLSFSSFAAFRRFCGSINYASIDRPTE